MIVEYNDLKNLPTADELEIVEPLWDDIGAANQPIQQEPGNATTTVFEVIYSRIVGSIECQTSGALHRDVQSHHES